MGAPSPVFIPEAFAISADPGDRNTIPTAPIGSQRASFNLGFPPLTMTPVLAGGKPMLGPDMNGILYMISSHTFYAQSGQPYQYSADVVAAIGGYAVGTLLGSIDGSTVWYNLVANNTDDPDDSASVGWVPLYSYGITSITGLIGGARVLTPAESAKGYILLSGALVGNQQIILPNNVQSWLIVNNTTGAFTMTVKTAAGGGVVVPSGGFASPVGVYGNGTDINPTVSPLVLPIDVNPTASTIPIRDNLGFLYSQTPAPGTNNTRMATTAFVQAAAATTIAAAVLLTLGSSIQSWNSPSRTTGVVYTNSTGRPIAVSIQVGVNGSPGGSVVLTVGGVQISQVSASGGGAIADTITGIIPPGTTYRLDRSGSINFITWSELS